MKTGLFFLAFLILGACLPARNMAQNVDVAMGLSRSNMLFFGAEKPYVEALGPSVHGPYAGITAEFKISGNFSLETGPLFIPMGYKCHYSEDMFPAGNSATLVFRVYNVHVPVHAKFFIYQKKCALYGMMGPFAGITLAGSTKVIVHDDGQRFTEKHKLNFNKAYGGYDRLEYGANLGSGVRFGSYSIGLLLSVSLKHGYSNGAGASATAFIISTSYRMGKLRSKNPMDL